MKNIFVVLLLLLTQCYVPNQTDITSEYKIQKLNNPPKIDAVWDKLPWREIEPITIDNYMGDKLEHFPFIQAKMAFDNTAICIIFRAEDQYIKAVTEKNQGPVYQDSCVDFFFSPEGDIKNGYFNNESV